ncbi:hypothetical protein V9T40_000045 [Parthenolecanium corni]|uniref:Cytochrome c oxidase copper chaperone n=1 Tax=Parthenolecanium corni TaxID=536013 RepID=A0AAN9TFS1_9HEMI
MSSIFAALKFGSADNDKNSKLPESENSSSVVKSVESTLKTDTPVAQGEKKPSPCCCCKETKQKRDACIVENGAENCTELIEAHRICMKGFGYDV